MKLPKTNRGFSRKDFIDRYGEKCSIQKSSIMGEDCIWLGINEPVPKVCIPGSGWKKVELPAGATTFGRMHLTQEMVKELLPYLQHFVETGELED